MANRTVKDAHSLKGTNPQYLVEKIIRTRIYECRYWKEECFALTGILFVLVLLFFDLFCSIHLEINCAMSHFKGKHTPTTVYPVYGDLIIVLDRNKKGVFVCGYNAVNGSH